MYSVSRPAPISSFFVSLFTSDSLCFFFPLPASFLRPYFAPPRRTGETSESTLVYPNVIPYPAHLLGTDTLPESMVEKERERQMERERGLYVYKKKKVKRAVAEV